MRDMQKVIDAAWLNGFTYRALAKALGVSRQRVHQIRKGCISSSGEAQVRHYIALERLAAETHDPRLRDVL